MNEYNKHQHIQDLQNLSDKLAKEIVDLKNGKFLFISCWGKTTAEKIENTIELKQFVDQIVKELSTKGEVQ
tara:strand:- start:229 stop:441 length:213 start_codon:yes stop_codon:yes gene_type:complete